MVNKTTTEGRERKTFSIKRNVWPLIINLTFGSLLFILARFNKGD